MGTKFIGFCSASVATTAAAMRHISHQNCCRGSVCVCVDFLLDHYVDTWNDENVRWKMKFVEITRTHWIGLQWKRVLLMQCRRAHSRSLCRYHTQRHSACVTIRLIEQPFISFGFFELELCVVSHSILVILVSFFFFLVMVKSTVSLFVLRV